MKKIYASLLFFSIVIFANAQWTNDSSKNTLAANANASDIQTANTNDGRTWIAFYSQDGNNYDMRAQLLSATGERMLGDSGVFVSTKRSGSATFVFNICVDKNNNLVIAFQFSKNGDYECVIQKINTAGKRLWDGGVDLGAGLAPYPTTLATNKIAVAWTNNGNIDYQIINPVGTTAWTTYKQFSQSSVSRPQLVANTDGGFSMVYQKLVSFPFYTNLYEQRFDTTGAEVWSAPTQISNIVTASYRYFDVHIDNDSTYIGYYGNPANKNRFNAYVQKINPNGVARWGVRGSAFADYSGDNDPYEQTIYITKDKSSNVIWAVCTITNSLQTTSGVYVQKFDAHFGNSYFGAAPKVVLPISSDLNSLAFCQVSLCEDFPLFLVTDNSNKLTAIKLNSNGNRSWKKIIGGSTNTKFRYGFTDVYAKQAVAVWQEDKGNGDMPYAQNINCDGTLGSESFVENNPVITPDKSLIIKSIYPNPVQSFLQAEIISTSKTNIHIYVSDVSGNVLQQSQQDVQAGSNIIHLNVSNLKAGSYFIKVMNSTGTAATIFNK